MSIIIQIINYNNYYNIAKNTLKCETNKNLNSYANLRYDL